MLITTPECDRAFTRSDALAKHMRTVHETEALRPSDPVPKSMQVGGAAGKGSSKFKIIIKTPQSHAAGQDDTVDEDSNGDDVADNLTELLAEHGFSEEELVMPRKRLHGLCHWQVKWAEREGERIKKECKLLEEQYKREWQEKEVLMKQVIRSELDWQQRRRAVLAGTVDVQIVPDAVTDGPAVEVSPLANGSGDKDNGN